MIILFDPRMCISFIVITIIGIIYSWVINAVCSVDLS